MILYVGPGLRTETTAALVSTALGMGQVASITPTHFLILSRVPILATGMPMVLLIINPKVRR